MAAVETETATLESGAEKPRPGGNEPDEVRSIGGRMVARKTVEQVESHFRDFLRGDKVGIVLGSPAREIIVDDVPRYLALDARVTVIWRPFFGVIEGADHHAVSLGVARSQRTTTVGTKTAFHPSR